MMHTILLKTFKRKDCTPPSPSLCVRSKVLFDKKAEIDFRCILGRRGDSIKTIQSIKLTMSERGETMEDLQPKHVTRIHLNLIMLAFIDCLWVRLATTFSECQMQSEFKGAFD